MRVWGLVVTLAVLSNCASSVPLDVRTPISGSPSVSDVRSATAGEGGQRVRWGGVIASLENRATSTEIEIVDQKLDKDGRPIASPESEGRFLARVPGFVDPEIYKQGQLVTVVGILEEPTDRTIGEFLYRYPVVEVETRYLWEPLPPPGVYYRSPFNPFNPYYWNCDPYFDPWDCGYYW